MKKILIIFVIFILNGCGLLALPSLPIYYSTSFIANAIKTKSYYNPGYVVTEECAKDATRAVISFTGKSLGNSFSVFRIKYLMTWVIHTAPTEQKINTHWVNYLLNPVVLVTDVSKIPYKSYPVMRVNDKENYQNFEFALLESGSNLEINLVNYHQAKGGSTFTLNGGVESMDLKGCKI